MKDWHKRHALPTYWPKQLLALLAAILLASCQPATAVHPAPCAAYKPQPAPPDATVITLWAQSARWNCWFAYAPALAMQQKPELNIHVDVFARPIDMAVFYQQIEQRMAAGDRPDLLVGSLRELWRWRNRGFIVPLTPCDKTDPIFDTILPALMATPTIEDEAWALPIAADPAFLLYNKQLLEQLGWSQDKIEQLPQEIADGRFTLQMMLNTAQDAIRQGVVAPGYGIWPDDYADWQATAFYKAFGGDAYDSIAEKPVFEPDSLIPALEFAKALYTNQTTLPNFQDKSSVSWGDRLSRHDAFSANRVLFTTENLRDIGHYWVDQGLYEAFHQRFGIANIPTAVANQPPQTTFSAMYMMATAKAFATPERQTAVCQVITATFAPEINALTTNTTFRFGTTTAITTHPAYQTHLLYKQIMPLMEHLDPQKQEESYTLFIDTVYRQILVAVQMGQLSPEAAAEQATTAVEQRMGDAVIIR